MASKLFLISFLSIVLAITNYSCNDKKGIALKDADDETLAQQIAKSKNFKKQQKLLEEILSIYRKDRTHVKVVSEKMKTEQLHRLKENPYFTDKEKKDSALKIRSQKPVKYRIKPEVLDLMKKSSALSKKINEEFPELKAMTAEQRKSVVKRAFLINGIKASKST